MKIKFFFFAVFLVLIFSVGCRRENDMKIEVVARVADQEIKVDEFRQFYELDPNFGIDSTGFSALLDEMNKFVDHYLAYIRAEHEGVLNDSIFVIARDWEMSREMLRQLYREVVVSDIKITEADLKEYYLKNTIMVHVRHLFSPDSLQAKEWLVELKKGTSFEKLAFQAFKDSLLSNNGGDLGWMSLGDLDEDFAAGIEHLNKGEISNLVRTKWGYHIIQLLGRVDKVIFSEDEFRKKRNTLRKKIKQIRSNELSNKFISNFMKAKNPQPVVRTLWLLWNAVAGIEEEKRELSSTISFTNELILTTRSKLKPYLDKPLIKYDKGEIKLGDYLQSLKKIPISNRPRFQTLDQLSNKIGIWVRDEFLLKEAYSRGLQNHLKVKEEIKEFMERQSYYYYLNKEIEDVTIPAEVKNYFSGEEKKNNTTLRKFHTLNEWIWWKAEKNLHRALRKSPPFIEIDYTKLRKEDQQIDWDRRIRMFVVSKPE